MSQPYPVPSGVLENCLINNQKPAVGEIILKAGVQLTVTLSQKVNDCLLQTGFCPGPHAVPQLA